MIKSVYWSSFCPILMKLEFSFDRFLKNTQISNFMEFCPVGAELFHEDKRVDLTRVIDILQNCSAKSTKMTKTAPRTKFQSTDKVSTKPQG